MVGVGVMVGSGVGVAVLAAVAWEVGVLVELVVVAPSHAHSNNASKTSIIPGFFMNRLLLQNIIINSFSIFNGITSHHHGHQGYNGKGNERKSSIIGAF
jgi:hypothetical protein